MKKKTKNGKLKGKKERTSKEGERWKRYEYARRNAVLIKQALKMDKTKKKRKRERERERRWQSEKCSRRRWSRKRRSNRSERGPSRRKRKSDFLPIKRRCTRTPVRWSGRAGRRSFGSTEASTKGDENKVKVCACVCGIRSSAAKERKRHASLPVRAWGLVRGRHCQSTFRIVRLCPSCNRHKPSDESMSAIIVRKPAKALRMIVSILSRSLALLNEPLPLLEQLLLDQRPRTGRTRTECRLALCHWPDRFMVANLLRFLNVRDYF